MNQQAGEVVSGRILLEQLIIKRVRQPGERMPVSLLRGSEGPSDRVPAQPVADVRILGDIAVVVIIDEGMAVDRVIERQRGYHKQEAQNYVAFFRR